MTNITKEEYLFGKRIGLTRLQIAECCLLSEHQLKRIISKQGWAKKKPVIKNETCFDIETQESMYWVGFLAADGNVDSLGRVRLTLKAEDKTHILKFRDFVGSTHKIGHTEAYKNRVSLEFKSRHFCNVLAKYGIVPNKSIGYVPKNLKDEFLYSFLRGYFDGDGGICESFSNKKSKTATLYAHLACSYPFYEWFSTKIDIPNKQSRKENHLQIGFNTNKSIEFLNLIYSNATPETVLDRKYNLYVKTVINNDRKTR